MARATVYWKTKYLVLCAVGLMISHQGQGAAEISPGRVKQIASTLPEHPRGLGEPITNRTAWDVLAAQPPFQHWLEAAMSACKTPLPPTSDDLFRDFSKTGNRDRWQNVAFARRGRIHLFALAELIENRGRYLAPLEETIKAVCAEATWMYPAHDRELKNFEGKSADIDLGSVNVAWQLATADYLLGDKLSPSVRQLIRDNLERKIFRPFREMGEGKRPENGWLRVQNNWNAVCLAGVTGSALAEIESREDRAWFIAAAEYYIKNFLSGFAADGYCSEGLGYWNYGFGNFLELGETVRQATGGKVDFLADPAARAPAFFWKNIEIINGVYPSIADCHPASKPASTFVAYICRRFGVSDATLNGRENFLHPQETLFSSALFPFLPETLPTIPGENPAANSPFRSWFPDGGVLICRNAGDAKVDFAVSLKGGNNGEHHNHNDVGSFIVVSGKSMMLIDPGSEIYTARTFGSHRYDSDVLNSFGHMVPVVAGKLQRSGKQAMAKVVRSSFTESDDTLVLDISSAYAVADLKKLERTFVFHRGTSPSLTVTDDVEFAKPNAFGTALVTWSNWKNISKEELAFTDDKTGVNVKIRTDGIPFAIESSQLTADVTTAKKPVRVGINLSEPVLKARLTTIIYPQSPPGDANKQTPKP